MMQFAYNNSCANKHYIHLIIISILILIVPATIRDVSVGTDVRVYQIPVLRKVYLFQDYISYYNNTKWNVNDRLYLILVYLCGKIFHSIHALFFFEELLVLVPIYYVVWKCRKWINPVYSLMAYECLFYIETYNVIRQNIAISFFVLAFYFYFTNQPFYKYLIWNIMAVGMHQSAIIFPVFPFLLKITEIKSKRNKRYLIGIIIALIVTVSFYYKPILRAILSILSFFPSRYSGKRYLSIAEQNFPTMDIVFTIFGIVIVFLARRAEEREQRHEWLLLMNYIVLSACYFTSMAEFGSRILWYFKIFNIFSYGYITSLFKDNSLNRTICFIVMFSFLSFYWIYIYYICGSAGIFPYEVAEIFKL